MDGGHFATAAAGKCPASEASHIFPREQTGGWDRGGRTNRAVCGYDVPSDRRGVSEMFLGGSSNLDVFEYPPSA